MSKIKVKGNRLAEIRIKKGLTVSDLSDLTGIHIAAISRAENGINSPKPKTAQKICGALGVNFDDIFEIIP